MFQIFVYGSSKVLIKHQTFFVNLRQSCELKLENETFICPLMYRFKNFES